MADGKAAADSGTVSGSGSHFIKTIVMEDLKAGRVKTIVTRFPPEPNGYLHIGHARSIVLNFELADEFGGRTHLRFDDTNPLKEDEEYVRAIQEDVRWLGYEWDELYFASDYFEEMYERAVLLIRKGLAYVDDQTAEQIRATRGTLNKPGIPSPYRDRSVEENLDLFARMRAGEFATGEKVLRAKIDMSSPNINMRDPVIYRIVHARHHNTGDKWCIYPMYAFAHPLEDAIEGVTHSLCTLEFADQRPFYDWVIRECEMPHVPRQYEFARLDLTNTVMSKRKLKLLVDEGVVDGWDDPRMPTLSGLRRRGFTPEAIKAFIRETGISRGSTGPTDSRMLDHFIREDLKLKVPRRMGVIDPLKVVIVNYPEGQVEMLEAKNNPENPDMGVRLIPFSREIFIDRDDFMENPPPKYHRLTVGNEVRLMNAYIIKCVEAVKDEAGNVVELRCTYDPETKSGSGSGRKVKGTIHWVEATRAVPVEFRLYEPLIIDEEGEADEADEDAAEEAGEEKYGKEGADRSFLDRINPNSLRVAHGYVEAGMENVRPQDKFQLVRHGYFNVDPKDTTENRLVFNRIVSLKSSFELK